MPVRTAVIGSRSGLHARPAAMVAEVSGMQPVKVKIAMAGSPACTASDSSSIFSLMRLAAPRGARVVLYAEGEGAHEALHALAKVLEADHA